MYDTLKRYFQHRKSLPAILMEKIVEKDDTKDDEDNEEAENEVNERTSFGATRPKKNGDLLKNHVHFKDSIVSKSSSSIMSNRVRRFSEQFHRSCDFTLSPP